MLTAEDCTYLSAIIDLNTCIADNDTTLAESARDALNALEQSDVLINAVGDAVKEGSLLSHPESADAFRVIIEGVTCVKDREYKLKVLETMAVVAKGSADELSAWLEMNAVESLDLSCEENQRAYASYLIRMCVAAKRYDIMESIRTKLEEVV